MAVLFTYKDALTANTEKAGQQAGATDYFNHHLRLHNRRKRKSGHILLSWLSQRSNRQK